MKNKRLKKIRKEAKVRSRPVMAGDKKLGVHAQDLWYCNFRLTETVVRRTARACRNYAFCRKTRHKYFGIRRRKQKKKNPCARIIFLKDCSLEQRVRRVVLFFFFQFRGRQIIVFEIPLNRHSF